LEDPHAQFADLLRRQGQIISRHPPTPDKRRIADPLHRLRLKPQGLVGLGAFAAIEQ